MDILLDSHFLVWTLLAPDRLSQREESALSATKNTLFFSPVSVSELFLKESKKRLQLPERFTEAFADQGIRELSFTNEHAEQLRHLPLIHSDPFDRLLAAQAVHEGLTLMTRDRILRKYPLTIF